MNIDLNHLLNREKDIATLREYIETFLNPETPIKSKKSIYVMGKSGIGKTWFVKNALKQLNFDPIVYNISNVRNKNIIETISNSNSSTFNVHQMLHRNKKKVVIVMDDIDGMNLGDKAGINSFIKLIRPKKTKKQLAEPCNNIPIICIGNTRGDKKIKELMKISYIIELQTPSMDQMKSIIQLLLPTHDFEKLFQYTKFDLRRLSVLHNVIKADPYNREKHYDLVNSLLRIECKTDDVKEMVLDLMKQKTAFGDHSLRVSDPDRTIVGLLFHENIMDIVDKSTYDAKLPLYVSMLQNFCFSDYYDRLIFQKQIWQLSEMSSLIKTFYNNFLLHKHIHKHKLSDVRFTKVLTKYSTEYNNATFINEMSQKTLLDKKDLFLYFDLLRKGNEDADPEISQLDTLRMYRFIEKYSNSYQLTINDEI